MACCRSMTQRFDASRYEDVARAMSPIPIKGESMKRVIVGMGLLTLVFGPAVAAAAPGHSGDGRSEEHTSELQSRRDLVCRLLLEKKKKKIYHDTIPTTHTSPNCYSMCLLHNV